MFHKEFYPTPPEVIAMMEIDCQGKIVLEPHAGKGNIVDFLHTNGAKQVLTCEINEDLQKIVTQKSHFICPDFFQCKPEQISHINQIVMNPPFSNADRHILHAWEIAPEGCEIIALCNHSLVTKSYGNSRLLSLINEYGMAHCLEDCFTEAERKTEVVVGLVKLYKPVTSSEFDFDGFYMEDEPQEESQGVDGLMPFNEVRALVNRYIASMKAFDQMKEKVDIINTLIKPVGVREIELQVSYDQTIKSKQEFSKLIQKKSWAYVFAKMKIDKYVTSGVMKDVNKFVETQEKVPFTMRNIYRMLQIIVGTREQTMNRALVEAIDNFTMHTFENRFGVEGWKTNAGHMLNKKFICENVVGTFHGFAIKYDAYNVRKMDDLVKVLCNLTATDYNTIGGLYHIGYCTKKHERLFSLEPNKWYDWGFFNVKFFKKGTMHVMFKETETWFLLNRAYAEQKGFQLPEKYRK